MALFGSGKDKSKGDKQEQEQVLAYLEEAARLRTAFQIGDNKGRVVPAVLLFVDPEQELATFQISGPLPGEKGGTVSPIFILDGLRIGGECKVLAVRPGQADLALPSSLALLERRKHLRSRLNLREGATLTALGGVFEGVGLTGVIENLSEAGARVKVERALEIKGEKKLSLHPGLIPQGHKFEIVKLSKIPKIPGSWECSGKAAYLEFAAGALVLGVAFEGFPPEALGALKSLVAGRAGTPPTELPPKSRRQIKEDAPEPVQEPRVQPPVAPPQASEAAPIPPAPKPLVTAQELPVPTTSEATPSPEPARNPALVRLKKRSRGILVVMRPGDFHRGAVAGFLHREGYGRVMVAGTVREVLDHLDDPGLHLILVDGGVAEMDGSELLDFIRQVVDVLPPVVLAVGEVSDATLGTVNRGGMVKMVLKPYELDEGFAGILESALEL